MVKSSMSRIMRSDVVDAPVGSEGGRRPSTLSTGHNGAGGAASGPLNPASAGASTASERRCFDCCEARRPRILARTRRPDLQAGALAAEGRSRAGWRVEGARDGCGKR